MSRKQQPQPTRDRAIIAALEQRLGRRISDTWFTYSEHGVAIEVRIRETQLHELPPEIGQLVHLEVLYLNLNELTTLPPEIGRLTQLRQVFLGHNELTTLPPEIG